MNWPAAYKLYLPTSATIYSVIYTSVFSYLYRINYHSIVSVAIKTALNSIQF